MEKIQAFLSRKIGGVPVIAIVALAAGVLLFYAIRMKPAVEVDAETEEVEEQGDTGGDPGDYSQPVFQATPTILQPSGVVSGGGSVTAIPQADSNELWRERVMNDLLVSGYSYNIAAGMISKFLNGESLTVEEAKVRDKAIAKYGMPPEGVEFAPDEVKTATPKPTPTPAPVTPSTPAKAARQGTPPLNHTVKNGAENTTAELSLLYYGYTTTATKNKIKAANPGKTPPWSIGTVVRIPVDRDPKYYKATSQARTIHQIAAKNGTTPAKLTLLNPKMKFPVKAGTHVRVR